MPIELNVPLNTVFTKEMVVEEKHLASTLGSGRVPVFGTPFLVAFIEATCNEGLQAYHPKELASVGAVVNATHLKPTPLGMKVRCEATYTGQDEKGLYVFEAKVYDEKDLVSTCLHKRGMIKVEKFIESTYSKMKQNG